MLLRIRNQAWQRPFFFSVSPSFRTKSSPLFYIRRASYNGLRHFGRDLVLSFLSSLLSPPPARLRRTFPQFLPPLFFNLPFPSGSVLAFGGHSFFHRRPLLFFPPCVVSLSLPLISMTACEGAATAVPVVLLFANGLDTGAARVTGEFDPPLCAVSPPPPFAPRRLLVFI